MEVLMTHSCPRCEEPFDRPTRNYLGPLADAVLPSGTVTCSACQAILPLAEVLGPPREAVQLQGPMPEEDDKPRISVEATPMPTEVDRQEQTVTEGKAFWQRQEYEALLAKVGADKASLWDSEMRHLWSSIEHQSSEAAKPHMTRCLEIAAEQTETCIRDEAQRLAASDSPNRALLLLGALYEASPEKKQKKLEKDISAFRVKHSLGQVWDFYGSDKTLITKCSGTEDIYKKLIDGEIGRGTLFRKNQIGPILRVGEELGEEDAQLELLLRPVAYYASRWAASLAILGFIGSWVHSMYNVHAIWQAGFLKTGAFAVCYLVLVGGVVTGQLIVALIAGFLGALLSRGELPNALAFGGFVLGNLLSNGLTALVTAALGGAIGAVIGVVRRPFLPKLRD